MKYRNRYPTSLRRVTNAAIGLKSLGPDGTANFGTKVAVISLQDCGSSLCRKRRFRAAARASKFDSSNSLRISAVTPSEDPFQGFSFLMTVLSISAVMCSGWVPDSRSCRRLDVFFCLPLSRSQLVHTRVIIKELF